MTTAPIYAEWTGEAFMPPTRFRKALDASLVVGERYKLEIIEERSAKSHAHYFAQLHDIWMSLPDHEAERFPTVDHLRAYALIREGFRETRDIVASSKAEAQRIAAFVRPMDEYAVVIVKDCVVRVATARSQSMRAMGKSDFQRSKDAVLSYAASLIGVKAEEAA
jgi:hypothetical protein